MNAEQILKHEIESGKSPSVQYFLFDSGQILYSFQQGFADVARKKPVDNNTTYHAFSVTKTFTAIAVLQLVESGKIHINNPVIQYLPDFPYGTEITIQHLLNHTAGIPNPIPVGWIHLDTEHQGFDRNAFIQSIYIKHKKVQSKPNEKFRYSNLGYLILGLIIEKISGDTFENYIAKNILQKLAFSPDDLGFTIYDKERHAKGYLKKISMLNLLFGLFVKKSKFMGASEEGWLPFKTFYVNGAPYGGLIGNPSAFVTYIQELLKENNTLLSNEYMQLLFEENKTNNGKATGMCMSWFTGKLNGVSYFAHAGGGGGYYCELRIYPEKHLGSVLFFNRTGISDERYLDQLDAFFVHEGKM